MARREHLLRDAEGPMIGQQSQKQDAFPMSKGRIGAIEEAVEGFKRASRADMTYDGFAQAQQRQRDEIKKQTKKVWDVMSLIVWNTAEKETPCRVLLACLWEGTVDEALDDLRHSVSPRHTKKHHELRTYLTKHKREMSND